MLQLNDIFSLAFCLSFAQKKGKAMQNVRKYEEITHIHITHMPMNQNRKQNVRQCFHHPH